MGDTKDLANTEAAKKIKELAGEIGTCMFCTYDGYKLVSRPMSAQNTDDEGNVWFLSDKGSNKNREILSNANVELFFAHGHDKFLSVHGKAAISFNKDKIKELWTPLAKVWFTDGVDDPRISVIKVACSEGHYWDTKHGKMVEWAKMAASLITGKTMDDGIEGDLKN